MTKVEVDEGSGRRVIIIAEEKKSACELCGEKAETRPYGPGGKRICWNCGLKDKEGIAKRMSKYLFGDEPTPEELAKLVKSMGE